MTSISTLTSRGSRATCTVARAGGGSHDVTPVDLVHRRELVHVGQEHRRPDDVLEAGAAGFEQRRDVAHDLLGLGGDVAVDQRAGGRDRAGICPERKSRLPARMAGE